MLVFYLTIIDSEEEKSKFEAIYLHYRNYMYYVANKILQSPESAEDAVHSAFIKIIENLHKIGEIDCPQAASYIVIIVKNISLNLYKRNKKDRERAVISMDEYEIADSGNLQNNCECKWTAEEVANKIEQLAEIYRLPMLLKYYHDKSTKEIAVLLDLKADTVKKRIQRGTLMLQALMGENDETT